MADKGGKKGRGAYLCRRRVCLDRAVQKKAFQRAFRRAVVVDEDEIVTVLLSGTGE